MQEKSIKLPARLRNVVQAGADKASSTALIESEARRLAAEQLAQERQGIEKVLATLRDIAGNLQAQQRQLAREIPRKVVDLAVAIASRFLHARLLAGDFPLDALVRKAIERLEPRQPVDVFLHPQDLAFLSGHLGEDKKWLIHNQEVRLLADAAIGRGGCRAQSGEISVLSNLDQHLTELHAHLVEALSEAADAQVPPLRPFVEQRQTA